MFSNEFQGFFGERYAASYVQVCIQLGYFHSDVTKLFKYLSLNGYPSGVLNKILGNFLSERMSKKINCKSSNFSNLLINYRDYLKKNFPHLIGYIINGELIFKTNTNKILNFLTFLKNHTNSQYKILSDICAVDFPQKKNRFEVVYNLLSLTYNSRITILVPVDEATPINSCVDIYSAAG